MKKWLMLLLALSVSGIALGAELELAPVATYHRYESTNDTLGVGVDATVKNLLGPVALTVGAEKIAAEINKDGLAGTDLDLIDTRLEAGVDVELGKLTLTPTAAVHYVFVDLNSAATGNNEVGYSAGVKTALKINEDVSLIGKVGYQWLETNVNLDNVNASLGLKFTF